MTPEEQHNRRLTGEQRHIIEKMTAAGLSKMSATKLDSPTDSDKVLEKLKLIHLSISKTMEPILLESNKKGIHDRKGDKEMFCSLLIQQLDSNLDKDELVFALAHVLVEQVFERL